MVVAGTCPAVGASRGDEPPKIGDGRVNWPENLLSTPEPERALRILCCLPVRGWRRFLNGVGVIKGCQQRESRLHSIEYVLVADYSDREIERDDPRVLECLLGLGASLEWAPSTSKIEACNVVPHTNFDVLVSLSDDMVCVRDSWDEKIAVEMLRRFPNLDGLLVQHDGHRDDICTLPIIGVNLYAKMGHVYHPAYKSLFADDELTGVASAFNRCARVGQHWFRHDHPCFGHPSDPLYVSNDKWFEADKEVFHARKAMGFNLPAVTLSIMVPSLTWRAEKRKRVLDEINRQINALEEPARVEVLVCVDQGEVPIGAKRNRMLDAAMGEYVAFVDDDDMVPEYYVRELLETIERSRPDVVSWWGVITKDGRDPTVFVHSRGRRIGTASSALRVSATNPPNHLNAVRRDLAVKARFPDHQSYSEDWAYAERLGKLLQTEAFIDKCMYMYLWDTTDSACVQRER